MAGGLSYSFLIRTLHSLHKMCKILCIELHKMVLGLFFENVMFLVNQDVTSLARAML